MRATLSLVFPLACSVRMGLLFGSLLLGACSAQKTPENTEETAGEHRPPGLDNALSDRKIDPLVIEDPSLLDKPECQPNRAEEKDYVVIAERIARQGLALSDEELSASLRRVETGRVGHVEGPVSPQELRELLRAALGSPLLLESSDLRPLRWARLPQEGAPTPGPRTEKVLLHDPLLGCISTLILVPAGTGPFPAVHALLGHAESPDYFATHFFGEIFQDNGYVLIIPETRAFDGARVEDGATRAMLRNGSTMMGVRVAEHRTALRYLRSREDVLSDHVGLMGHSGGSTAGNLTVRLGLGYAAYVSDYAGSYHNIVEDNLLIDETAPSLFALSLLVNDFSTVEVPILRVPYGYVEGSESVFKFFDERLKASPH